MGPPVLLALILFHGLIAIGASLLAPRLGRRVFWWCALAPLAALVWAIWQAPSVVDGQVVTEHVDWVPELGLDLGFRFDAFSLLMVVIVSGIGVLVFVYSSSYFAGHESPKIGTLAAQLTAFSGAMFGLVVSDNVLLLFVFWELTSITSYLLIGYEDEKGSARAAARQALLITGGGGLALLAGLVLLSQAAGTTSLHGILEQAPSGGVVPAALILVIFGAATKSAQVPFHSWLPGAMVAPTPVSAYLHSATMVKAGIYLIARFAPAFALEGVWRPIVLTIGGLTMLVGGYRALRQHDLKLLLAFGTVSQLGFLVVLFGTGVPGAVEAGAALLLAHALFKAALFLTVGVVDHQAHTRDVRRLTGLARRLPVLAAAAILAAASMAGLIPLFGFVAKELAYGAYLDGAVSTTVDALVLTTIVIGSMLTFAYSWRFVWGAFASKAPDTGADLVGPAIPRPTRLFVAPVVLLGALCLVLGLAPALADPLVVDGAQALDPGVSSEGLSLWHGITAALLLSLLTVGGGIVLAVNRRRVERLQASAPSPRGSDDAYRGSLTLLNRIADRVTGVVQSGSLPVYLTIIALTVLALPGVALAFAIEWPRDYAFAESPLQVVVVAMLVVGAVATVLARSRFVAVLLVGVVGYTISALYLIQGGVDLALTQLLIETLTVVVFVLVLRHLPKQFPVRRRERRRRRVQVVVALAIGTFVSVFTVVAVGSRSVPPISEDLAKEALLEGEGRNVVNVILTDFRGFDTLGEITVLALAALGIVSLVVADRRRRSGGEPDDGSTPATHEARDERIEEPAP